MNDDETHDPIWGELWTRALRAGPRLAPYFGECPCCHLGASDAASIGSVTWCYCITCMTRWPVLDPLARLDPAPDAFLELFMEALSMCQDLTPLPEGIPSPAVITTPTEDFFPMRQTTTPPPKTYGIDLNKFVGKLEGSPFGATFLSRHRILLTDPIIDDVRQHPPFERNPITHRLELKAGADEKCWHRIRGVVVDQEKGLTFEKLLHSEPGVSPFAIRNVMLLLMRLQERRALLEEELRALDVIAAAFVPSEERVSP